MIFRNRAWFQGVPVQAVQYRRSFGLRPEIGWIDVLLQHLQQIKVKPDPVPWKAVNGNEVPGGLDIRTFYSVGNTTTAIETVPGLEGNGADGFKHSGILTMKTMKPDGSLVDQISYAHVYVDSSGIEELVPDRIKKIKEHNTGKVRVPLTDIRHYYEDHGPLVCEINVRLESGNYKADTIEQSGIPWSASKVLTYLFSMLPGNPALLSWSPHKAMDLPTPNDIVGIGEPVVRHIERILEEFGLVAQMHPSGNYVLSPKLSNSIAHGQVPTFGGNTAPGTFLSTERKTTWLSNNPVNILVIGHRRIRRITIPMIPVIQGDDDRWYKLADVGTIFGYALDRVNQQILVGGDKNFLDVPPGLGGNGKLHAKRRQSLRRAYHCYAPAHAFERIGATTAQGVGITDKDLEQTLYVPMTKAAYYKNELSTLNIKPPEDQAGSSGDEGQLFFVPPVVRANRIGIGFFTDWNEYVKQFDSQIASLTQSMSDSQSAIQKIQELAQQRPGGEILKRAEVKAPALLSASSGEVIQIDADFVKAAAAVGMNIPTSVYKNKMATLTQSYFLELIADARAIEYYQQKIQKAATTLNLWNEKKQKAEQVYKKYKGIHAWINHPQSILEDGSFSLDQRTGILTSSEPLCLMNTPFAIDKESLGQVIEDGQVQVTFGYELPQNNISAFTSFGFISDGDETSPTVKLSSINTPPAMKAKTIPMDIRMYERELGVPMNLKACHDSARGAAVRELKVPYSIDGYTYRYSGFRSFILHGGAQSIQYEWSGGRAYTYLSVNNPKGRMPLGPADLAGRKSVATVDPRKIAKQAQERRDGP